MPSVFRYVMRLLFPPVCAACGRPIGDGNDDILCPGCMADMPLTHFWREKDNPVADKFAGHIPFVNACAMIYFVHGSRFRNLIHSFKYRGEWRYARRMGELLGGYLAGSGLYDDIDAVVPIPLHPLKRLRRGYNQSEYIARGMASALGAEVDTRSVVRRVHNKSQARRSRSQRWDNAAGVFAVRRPGRLAGRHILLVDDVVTTGATVVSCAETIVKAVPDCRISIAALAVSAGDLYRKIPNRDGRR